MEGVSDLTPFFFFLKYDISKKKLEKKSMPATMWRIDRRKSGSK